MADGFNPGIGSTSTGYIAGIGGAAAVAYTSGTDVTGLGTLKTSGKRHRYCVIVDTAVQMSIRTAIGTLFLLNDGVPLPVNTVYELGAFLPTGVTYTIRFSASCNVQALVVSEAL